MSGYALTRRDTQRLADYVRRSEARRPSETQGGGQLPQLRDIQFFACTSEPNIEAIEDGGNWPHTVEAIPLLKSEGFTLNNIRGVCNEFSGGGGGGCGRGGCVEGANLEVVGTLYPALTQFSATLTWVGVTNRGVQDETWHWQADGVVATLMFTGHREFEICNPIVLSPSCTRFEMTVTSGATGIPQARYLNYLFNPVLGGGGEACEGTFPIKSYGTGNALCGEYGADVFWSPAGSSTTPTATTIESDASTYNGNRNPVPVFMSRLMNGALFFGEVFPATNIGGMWYAVGAHHSFISGRRTNRVTAHTLWMDVCENEVPFIYWPDNTITAKEDTRHLVGWVSAKRKYVMVAMGGCDV